MNERYHDYFIVFCAVDRNDEIVRIRKHNHSTIYYTRKKDCERSVETENQKRGADDLLRVGIFALTEMVETMDGAYDYK